MSSPRHHPQLDGVRHPQLDGVRHPQLDGVRHPQLDGVRAVAIGAVVAYHLGYLPGGWIGVDVFFVLSGYLITSILLGEGQPLRRLTRFWGRRARRLFPAVVLLLIGLSAYAGLGGPGLVPAQMRAPALSTVFYTANWQQIASGNSYFARFLLPSPLQHTWSLAIEEQYYLVWPLLLGVMLIATRGAPRRLLALTGGLAGVSAVWMGFAAHLYGANRAYLGTDTRAWELLLGGAMAMAVPPARSAGRARGWSGAALAGCGLVGAGIGLAGRPTAWMWDGGLVGIGLAAAVVIAGSVRAPGGPAARVLATAPAAWVGRISYSLYLWHWPVIVLMTEDATGLTGAALLLARLAAMLVLSCASYYLVERPLRALDWGVAAGRVRVRAPALGAAAVALTAVVVTVATIGRPAASSAAVSLASLADMARSSPTPGGPLDLRPGSPADPYRVWIFGDSVMADGSPGVQAALQATGEMSVVMNSAFPGWGLTRDKGWPFDSQASLTRARPQIALGTWSWDDQAAESSPAAYRSQLEAAIRNLLSPGEGIQLVVLLQFPQSGPDLALAGHARRVDWQKRTQAQDAWDRAAAQAVATFPGHALYLPTDALFAPAGRFYTWFRTPTGAWIRARKLDNTHFCPYGAASFGGLVVEQLTPALHLGPPAPGWELGPWVRDRRFNDPPGACPNDRPPPGYRGVARPEPPLAG